MTFKVRADLDQAVELLENRGVSFNERDEYEIEEQIAKILVDEKGYPDYTRVEINGTDAMDMALVVYPDGSWELV